MRSGASIFAAVALAGAVAVTSHGSTATAEATPAADDPSDVMVDDPAEFRGDEAVEVMAVSDSTDEIAAEVDLSRTELVDELRSDDTMFVTGEGQVGFADEATVTPPSVEALQASPLTPGDVLALHSKPGSSKVLFLDFDGHTTSGDYWNSTYTAGASIVSEPYSTDANAAFSASERANIYEIWQRVAEDFMPFDIDVTTTDPGVNALRRTSSDGRAFGQRMVISPTDWYGRRGTVGIALVGVFDASRDHSAFVFQSASYTPTSASIAEAVSHEVGHTLGLLHDGRGGADYYLGHGSWAPLMGNPIGKTVTQWSKGEYSGATNREDDIAKIIACTGERPDDHPDRGVDGPTQSTGSPVRAVLGASGDVDVFPVDVAAGPLSVDVTPAGPGSNLLPTVRVRNASGAVVGSYNPTGPTWSSASVSVGPVPAGRYTVEVAASGWGSANSGFTAYGSMGAYDITVNAAGTPPVATGAPALAYAAATRLSMQPVC